MAVYTIQEEWGNQSNWTLNIEPVNINVNKETFQLAFPNITASYTADSTKGYASFYIGSSQIRKDNTKISLFATYGDEKGYVTTWEKGEAKSFIGILTSAESVKNTSTYFNTNNPTEKTINCSFYATQARCRSGRSEGSYDGNISSFAFELDSIVNLTLDAPPTYENASLTVPEGELYYKKNQITFSISNVQAQYGGYIQSITFGGYGSFKRNYYSATNIPPSTITYTTLIYGSDTPYIRILDSRGQTTTHYFEPITGKEYVIKTSNTTIKRINSTTSQLEEEGRNAVLQTTITYTSDSRYSLQAPTVYNSTLGANANITWYTSWNNTSGFSGTISNWSNVASDTTVYGKITTELDDETSYEFRITPKTTFTSGSYTRITLPQSFYLLVGRQGGKGLGIGMKPASDNLYIRMPTYIVNPTNGSNLALRIVQSAESTPATFGIDWTGSIWKNNNLITVPSRTGVMALTSDLIQHLTDGSGTNSIRGSGTKAEGNITWRDYEQDNFPIRINYSMGSQSFAEGWETMVTGQASHVEGAFNKVTGGAAHGGGFYTITAKDAQTVIGRYNIEDTGDSSISGRNYGKYALIIGNGNPDASPTYDESTDEYIAPPRSNVLTVDWQGLVQCYGKHGVDSGLYTYSANSSDVERHIGYIIGSGGVNAGIYDYNYTGTGAGSDGAWMIYSTRAETHVAVGNFIVNNGNIQPNTTNKYSCGASGKVWTAVYARNTIIQTSDAKQKDVIGSIDYAKDLIMNLKPIEYQWKDSDHNRIHMGLIAQDVAKVGKDLNKNLSLYQANYKDIDKKYNGEEVDDSKLDWSLGYGELIAPMIKVIQDQEKRIQQLEEQLLKK